MAAKTEVSDELRRVPLFSGLDRNELAMLVKLVKEQRYPAGTEIVKAGTSGHGLYLIREGQVSVKKDGRTVATMGPGQFFGEVAILDGGPRTADVLAVDDTICMTLVSWDIKPLLMENAGITYKMLLEVTKRLRSEQPRHAD